jgi:phosphatidylglycerol:prolipoprotein diacylglycerol transferase
MIDAYGIHLGPLYFRFYGILLMLGALAAVYLIRWMMRRDGRDPDLAWDAFMWALVFGIIGARLYHVFTPSESLRAMGIDTMYYLTHPLDILFTWRGGLGMPGAIAGGVLGLYIFTRRRKISFGMMLDYAAPGVALAQAIGRWGNYVNQELYGPPTDLPWGIFIRPENRLVGYAAFERFHPLFLYESLWNLALAFFLVWVWRRFRGRLLSGDLFLLYLVGYPLGRFVLEFLRIDIVRAFGLNFNQALMLLTAIISALAIILRHRRARPAMAKPTKAGQPGV